MATIRFLLFSSLFLILACNSKPKDDIFKIYHLTPSNVWSRDSLKKNIRYVTYRNDFFAVKNFNPNNEQHKIAIDSFVINHIQKDSFLYKNNKPFWNLRFFKYGDDIDENTAHEYGTDYTIHILFAQEREIANFFFDNITGYSESSYWESFEPKKLNSDRRKIIEDYFRDSTHNNFIKVDTLKKERSTLSVPEQINLETFTKFYPKMVDTIKDLGVISFKYFKVLKPSDEISVLLAHNFGATIGNQMILSTHDEKMDLIEKLYIGKATDFDNGKSQTIDYRVLNKNEIVFDKVEWGYVEKGNEEEIDTVKHERLTINIDKMGRIEYENTVLKERVSWCDAKGYLEDH